MKGDRLLYVLPHPGFFTTSGAVGGHVAHVRGFAAAVARAGIDLDVVGPTELTDALGDIATRVVTASANGFAERLLWSGRVVRAVGGLARQHRYRACYARYAARFAPHVPALKRSLRGTPLVLEINSLGSQRHRWMHFVDARAVSAANRIVTVSKTLAALVAARFPDVSEKLVVLPNGVDLRRFEFAQSNESRRHEANKPLLIGYVGILKSHYGIEDLIEASGLLHPAGRAVELIIVGDGPARSELETLAQSRRNIRFAGAVSPDQIPELLRGMDVLVYTNTRQNGFQSPIKLYEYMAAGRAIVAADTPQVCEIFGRGDLALTYRCEDVSELAAKLQSLVSDEVLRRNLGAAAAAEAKHHSWDSRIRQLWGSL